ncbi:hypothetical protein [Bacteroides sp. 51]|uniref:hypothetical protein n=1 Tax=Bacteroides sp. 51 TaxID=2302938 RepID=UPI0013D3EC1E|nr:hypothetical protein [Bacteroides sp. 51]NDV82942.1 hypothetical protein [Bacteroides sp. 51]
MRYPFVFVTIIGLLLSFLSSCSSSKEKMFAEEAEEQNRLCPMMIDNYTRADSIRYTTTDNTFHYYYTLIGDADNIEVANQKRQELQEQLPIEVKKATGLTIHRNHHVTMKYVYFSGSNGNELFRVVITPDMY